MEDAAKIIFWAVVGVIHLPTLAVPFIYWSRRRFDPIKARRPAVFMLCLCITVLFIWQQVIRNMLGAYIGVWFDVVVGSILLLSIFESFFVFSFSLYIAYNKTREQVAMYQALQNSDDPKKMDAILRSIQWSSFLLSNKFAYLWVFGSTTIWMLLVAGLTSSAFKLYNTPLADVDARRVVMPAVLSLLVLGRCLITIL
jgi:hypothetical protein